MGENWTKYGWCKGCGRWVPRDEMESINVIVYDMKNNESRIRIRLCPVCHARKTAEYKMMEWDNDLKYEHEIALSRNAIVSSTVDDSESALRVAGFSLD